MQLESDANLYKLFDGLLLGREGQLEIAYLVCTHYYIVGHGKKFGSELRQQKFWIKCCGADIVQKLMI